MRAAVDWPAAQEILVPGGCIIVNAIYVKRPGWMTLVGAMGMILGAFGVLGAAILIRLPDTVAQRQRDAYAAQKKAIDDKNENDRRASPNPTADTGAAEQAPRVARPPKYGVAEYLVPPEWFNIWCRILGAAALLVAIYYAYAGYALLAVKAGAVKAIYTALGLRLFFGVVKYISIFVGIGAASATLMPYLLGAWLVAMVLDVLLVGAILYGNRPRVPVRELVRPVPRRR